MTVAAVIAASWNTKTVDRKITSDASFLWKHCGFGNSYGFGSIAA